MSTIPFDQLVKQVEQLTPSEKAQLEQVLHGTSPMSGKTSDALSPGWAKGLVISDDFDEPLDDFKEYSES